MLFIKHAINSQTIQRYCTNHYEALDIVQKMPNLRNFAAQVSFYKLDDLIKLVKGRKLEQLNFHYSQLCSNKAVE